MTDFEIKTKLKAFYNNHPNFITKAKLLSFKIYYTPKGINENRNCDMLIKHLSGICGSQIAQEYGISSEQTLSVINHGARKLYKKIEKRIKLNFEGTIRYTTCFHYSNCPIIDINGECFNECRFKSYIDNYFVKSKDIEQSTNTSC